MTKTKKSHDRAKIADPRKYISKKFWYLINWKLEDKVAGAGLVKDEDGYWIYLNDWVLKEGYAGHNIHEPLASVNWYLRRIDEAVQTGDSFDW